MEFTTNLPLPYHKGTQLFTLNIYRNAHYHTLAKFKRDYSELCVPLLKDCPSFQRCSITYELHLPLLKNKKDKNLDLSNTLATVDKVILDTLQSLGVIPNDTIAYVPEITFKYVPDTSSYIKFTIKDINDNSRTN